MLHPSNHLRILVLASATILVTVNGVVWASDQRLVEVFTTSGIPIFSDHQGDRIQIYEIDGIVSIERDLSIDMPADPEKSKRIALERIQHMDDQSKTKMHMAAKGLAKAMQYGVDRYPAIVFDGQAVVYGVTDVQIALAHYRAWRREGQ